MMAKNKEKIEEIKSKYKSFISDIPYFTRTRHMSIIFGKGTNKNRSHCLAILLAQNLEKIKRNDEFRLVIYFDRKSMKHFDYNSIFEDLNKTFGYYWRFVRYFSGKRHVRIIDFEVINKFPHSNIKIAALYISVAIFRALNSYIHRWENYNGERIKNLRELIYAYYMTIKPSNAGINDHLLIKSYQYNCGEITKEGFMTSIDNFLEILRNAFGEKMVLNEEQKSYIINRDMRHLYQTGCYRFIKEILLKG